jgi:peptidyl-prolyl cis-trans isomerase A (cyclophilin A)
MTPARRAWLVALVAVASMAAAPPQPDRPQGWYAVIETSLGSFTVRLLPEQAPQTVAHFAAFAQGRMEWVDVTTGDKLKRPFYDGLAIHRVTSNQRFEAGDPTGTSHGAPLVWVPKEPGPVDFSRPFRVGMTGSSMQRVSGVLFFVSMVAEPYLNAAHNCFGEVVDGRNVVEAICGVRTDKNRVPVEPVTIKKVSIMKSGNPPPLPDPVRYRPPHPIPEARPADESP